jgi:hypothetical protein
VTETLLFLVLGLMAVVVWSLLRASRRERRSTVSNDGTYAMFDSAVVPSGDTSDCGSDGGTGGGGDCGGGDGGGGGGGGD